MESKTSPVWLQSEREHVPTQYIESKTSPVIYILLCLSLIINIVIFIEMGNVKAEIKIVRSEAEALEYKTNFIRSKTAYIDYNVNTLQGNVTLLQNDVKSIQAHFSIYP